MIDQSEWRDGLPDPDYERIITNVHNLIIHHTAGSNTNTDYFLVVRNIYIYHTEIRGWSDIGYNYLIAQDGSIFKGRDPGNGEQDNVMGAHFCAANTGTMGISILGTYTDIAPPDLAIEALIRILTWKTGKDSLDPTGIYPHSLNNNLPVIAGHRDGCATECPGEMLYAYIAEIRDSTLHLFEECNFFIKPLNVPAVLQPELTIYQQYNEIYIKSPAIFHVELFNVLGQKVGFDEYMLSPTEKKIRISDCSLCNLILLVYGESIHFSRVIFIP